MELDKDESASTDVFSRFDAVHQGPLTRTVLQDTARPLQGLITPMAFELLLHNTATLLRLPLVTEDDRMALVLCTLSVTTVRLGLSFSFTDSPPPPSFSLLRTVRLVSPIYYMPFPHPYHTTYACISN